MRSALVLGLLVLAHSGPVLAQQWPSFRGPKASGLADRLDIPTTWDAEAPSENVLWATPIPGLGHSSPVVWGDRVFLTTAVSEDPNSIFIHGLDGKIDRRTDLSPHSWRVYALDRSSGAILWQREAHSGEPRIQRHRKNTYASATPVTDGTHLVVWFGSEGLYCYDLDGRLLWKQDLGVMDAGASYDDTYDWGIASSPIIHENLAIVLADSQGDSFIAAFDLRNGEPAWRTPRDVISSFSTPTVHEGPLGVELIVNGAEKIHGYDPRTGTQLWELRGSSKNTTPTPIVAHGLFFVVSGYRVKPIFAIRPGASGDITPEPGTGTNDFLVWSSPRDGSYITTPIVYGDYLYTCQNNGVLACFRARTGERVYRQRIAAGTAFSASPIAADGRLYFTSEDGEVYVVRAGPRYELLATNPMGEVCMATPAAAQGQLLFRTLRRLVAVGSERGSPGS